MANEKRLIYANALEIDIEKMFVPYGDGTYSGDKEAMIYDEALVDVLEALDKAPTVDAVEVVRCKDCKHWKDGVSGCTDYAKCCEIGYYMVGENGYCCYGEKKEK